MSTTDRKQRVLVTGANRGIGLEITRQFLSEGAHVFALARNPDASSELQALLTAHPNAAHVARVDVADDLLVAAAHEAVKSIWDSVDIIVNNAATYGRADSTLGTLELAELRQVLETNSFGPIRMTRTFLDLLRRGETPRLVNITSLMGSIEDNQSGGAWAYRISKTCLNMITRNLASELSPLGIVVAALHPGWVQTEMGGRSAPLAVNEAAASLIKTISRLCDDHVGGFFDRDGTRLPW